MTLEQSIKFQEDASTSALAKKGPSKGKGRKGKESPAGGCREGGREGMDTLNKITMITVIIYGHRVKNYTVYEYCLWSPFHTHPRKEGLPPRKYTLCGYILYGGRTTDFLLLLINRALGC